MKKHLFVLLLLFSLIIIGCDVSVTSIDSVANDASPYAPAIVTGSGSSGSRALVDSADQDFGEFGMIKGSALNYNSMIDSTVPDAVSACETIEAEACAVGDYTLKRDSLEGPQFYQNDEAIMTSIMTTSDIEIRQFDAFVIDDAEGYEYSRCIFYWPGTDTMDPGVDITEVWEYADRKEVSVTMYDKDSDTGSKYLAVTSLSGELQKTSMLVGSINHDSESGFEMSDYNFIGYIDFEITTAGEDAYSDHIGSEDTFLFEYPAFSFLQALHEKSVSLFDAKAVSIDVDNVEPYTGFSD